MSTADRQRRIRATLDQLSDLVKSFTFTVSAEDFGDWLAALDSTDFAVRWFGDEGTQVHAHASGYYSDRYWQVHCVTAGIDDHQLPDRDTNPCHLNLPAAEAVKLRTDEAVSR